MVSAESKGLSVSLGPAPAARATIIVSPTARDAATTMAADKPERAAGDTTLRLVSMRVAPNP